MDGEESLRDRGRDLEGRRKLKRPGRMEEGICRDGGRDLEG